MQLNIIDAAPSEKSHGQRAGTDVAEAGAEACAFVGLRAIRGRTSEQSITTVITLIAGAYFPMFW